MCPWLGCIVGSMLRLIALICYLLQLMGPMDDPGPQEHRKEVQDCFNWIEILQWKRWYTRAFWVGDWIKVINMSISIEQQISSDIINEKLLSRLWNIYQTETDMIKEEGVFTRERCKDLWVGDLSVDAVAPERGAVAQSRPITKLMGQFPSYTRLFK